MKTVKDLLRGNKTEAVIPIVFLKRASERPNFSRKLFFSIALSQILEHLSQWPLQNGNDVPARRNHIPILDQPPFLHAYKAIMGVDMSFSRLFNKASSSSLSTFRQGYATLIVSFCAILVS